MPSTERSATERPAEGDWSVVLTAPALAAEAMALLERAGCTVHAMPAYPSADAVAARVAEVRAHAILTRQGRVTAAAIDASPRLRIVARHGVGVDDVDVEAARARGVVVTRAAGSNAVQVAEHAMALILALVKGLPWLGAGIAAGGWRCSSSTARDVAGLRLGLVGAGAIGREVAARAGAFGMVVRAFDPGVALGASRTNIEMAGTLPALLAATDVLSLHCPLTPATRHLIDAAALAHLPEGAIVVNTARGGIIDEAALAAALDSGHVAGAGLDVFEIEPPPVGYRLRAHPRVIATPHVAGVTPRSLSAMGHMAAECIVAVLTGAIVPPDRIV